MGKWSNWWPWGRGRRKQDKAEALPMRDVRVDTALVIEAARHVVTTRIATRTSLGRYLYIAPETAAQLLVKLEHCEVIAPPTGAGPPSHRDVG